MFILPVIIAVSIILYVYYKVAIIRNNDPLTQLYYNAKARIFLGSFIFFFGINQYLFYQTKISLYIGIVFLVLGGMQMYSGFKRTQHYKAEWRKLND